MTTPTFCACIRTSTLQSTDTDEEALAFTVAFRSGLDLLDEEWAAIPKLTLLRKVATVVWRAGRWREGKSTLEDVLVRLADVTPHS